MSTQYAGEFDLDVCTLITSKGLTVDLRGVVYQIDFFEELEKSCITGSLTVLDTNNLLTDAQIIGQDYLQIKLSTPGTGQTIDFSENALVVYKIGKRNDISKGGEMFMLSLISAEALYNQRLRLSRSFTGANSEIFEKIMTDETIINSKKSIVIEPTRGARKHVVPNIHPLKFVNHLMRDSRSDTNGSPHYFFYETTKGFNFRTLQSLYNQDYVMEYNDGDAGVLSEGLSKTKEVDQEYRRVIGYNISDNGDMLTAIVGGQLGANCVKVNTYNHTYERINFSIFDNFYDYDRINGRNKNLDNPIYTESTIDAEGNNLGSFTDSSSYLHTVHSDINNVDALHEGTLTENQSPHNILHRKAKMFELGSSIGATMRVNGHCNLAVGQVIYMSRPSGGGVDAEYSGRFLIHKLRHTFLVAAKKHEISMSIIKDSSSGKEVGNNILPKAAGSNVQKIENY